MLVLINGYRCLSLSKTWAGVYIYENSTEPWTELCNHRNKCKQRNLGDKKIRQLLEHWPS